MRARVEPQPTASVLAPAPAERPAPLQELTFDILAFLGDELPREQLQNVLEGPPASVPVAGPPPTPAAAGGQTRLWPTPRRQLERAQRLLRLVKLPPSSALPPGVSRQAVGHVLFQYAVAQQRLGQDDNM